MKKEIIAEYIKSNPNASITEIVENCAVAKSTAYKYLKEIKAEIKAEIESANEEVSEPAVEPVAETKSYNDKTQKGYSIKQVGFVYSHCKNKDLYIAPSVLKLMYSWADKFGFVEPDPEMENLRNAACKLVKCVSLGKYDFAQKKARYIEAALKRLAIQSQVA